MSHYDNDYLSDIPSAGGIIKARKLTPLDEAGMNCVDAIEKLQLALGDYKRSLEAHHGK